MAPSGKKKYVEALPPEWKSINKKCMILQLNGTVMQF